MSDYTKKWTIPPCYVQKALLIELENYILQKASDLSGSEDFSSSYRVALEDKNTSVQSEGKLEVKRIEECRFPLPLETESIRIGLPGWVKTMRFELFFCREAPYLSGPQLEIRYEGASAREVVNGMAQEVLEMVRRYPHPSPRLRRRSLPTYLLIDTLVFVMVGVALFAFSQLGTLLKSPMATIALIATCAGGILLAYRFYSSLIPYCVLDTLNATKPVENAVWFSRLVFGWLIMNIGLRFLLKFMGDI